MVEKPRVSVGLPVYNGENFLKTAIESILAQKYTDFELVISDNASEDATESICEAFAKTDPRIRYYRNEKNLGLFTNFNRVFELSRGEYFNWLAHDDALDPEFLSQAVERLDQDPSIVLCYCEEQKINETGQKINCEEFTAQWDSDVLRERIHDILFVAPFSVAGLIRASALRKTRLHQEFIGSDWNLAFELALVGRFCRMPGRLYICRTHPQMSIRKYTKHERMAWSNPAKAKKVFFPTWRQSFEYFRSIDRYPMPFKDKYHCYLELRQWLFSNRTRVDLIKDLRMAFKKILLRSKGGEKIYQLLRSRTNLLVVAFLVN